MKFRKKPVVIEAEQFRFHDQGDDSGHMPDGVCLCVNRHLAPAARLMSPRPDMPPPTPHVHTLKGPLNVSHGDWIITGVNGEKYPCKPDIFTKTYEAVEPTDIESKAIAAVEANQNKYGTTPFEIGMHVQLIRRDVPGADFATNSDRWKILYIDRVSEQMNVGLVK